MLIRETNQSLLATVIVYIIDGVPHHHYHTIIDGVSSTKSQIQKIVLNWD